MLDPFHTSMASSCLFSLANAYLLAQGLSPLTYRDILPSSLLASCPPTKLGLDIQRPPNSTSSYMEMPHWSH